MDTLTSNQSRSNTIGVGALMQEMLQSGITQKAFRFPFTEEENRKYILAGYTAEVASRHKEFVPDDETFDKINQAAKSLTHSNKQGMMFCGTCGNGKTTLLYGIRRALNYLYDRNHFADYKNAGYHVGIQVVDAREILNAAKMEERGDTRYYEYKTRYMLAIEDLGKEPAEVQMFGNVISPITELIETRYAKQLYTIVTTNLAPKQIREHYGDRVADRFNEMFDVIRFTHDSYRGL